MNKADRLAVREQPPGFPIMLQSWGKLFCMHWKMPVASFGAEYPDRLQIDTFEGNAWISFTIWNARFIFTPPLPWISDFHEINVRTYVFLDDVPGVWSLSRREQPPGCQGGWEFLHLPYQKASITLEQQDQTIFYASSCEGAWFNRKIQCDLADWSQSRGGGAGLAGVLSG